MMNANFKPVAVAFALAALLGIVPAHAQQTVQPETAPSQAQDTPAVPPGMGGMMGPGMMGRPGAGAPWMSGNMGMMGMMQMCPMMHGMMGMRGPGMAFGSGMMMGYGGLALSDAQVAKLASIQKALIRKETELMRQMYDARLDAQRNAYAVLSKGQREQLGGGTNTTDEPAKVPGTYEHSH